MTTRLVILGKQGAGKGTQCSLLSEHYTIPHISTGDILRAAVSEGSDLGVQAKAVMDAGELVSDELILGIVEVRLAQSDAQPGFLLDGFPRTGAQARGLADLLAPGGLDLVVNIEVPDDVVMGRMLARGRDDDTEDAIGRRLELYRSETAPLIDFFTDRGKLVEVNGLGTEAEVQLRVVAAIEAAL
jgi:adenylate kinase